MQQPDRWADEHAVLHGFQQIQRFFIGMFAMIDDIDTATDRALDEFRGAAMGVDLTIEIMGGDDSGADFFLGHDRARQTPVRV